MAVVKFLTSNSPLKNIINYVKDKEKTLDKLISGKDCLAESAMDEFMAVKREFHKLDGRQYYHIIQSFSPDDKISATTANEIGYKFAEYFEGYQALVVTHINKNHLHNHIVLNSVNFENGKKFHQSRDEMLVAKQFSNELCRQYGLSVTEAKASRYKMPKWKKELKDAIQYALENTYDKDAFIEVMQMHGYDVKWEDHLKYVTFTTPDGHKCRDNKLFDERYLKDNMEIYYAMGGCDKRFSKIYHGYETPKTGDITTGLLRLIGDLLGGSSQTSGYTPRYHPQHSEEELLKMEAHGLRVDTSAYYYYSEDDEEQEQGMGMYL